MRPRIGLELHTPKTQTARETARQIEIAREVGFGFIQSDLIWARVETKRGRYDFSAFDTMLAEARENGLGLLWALAFGNTLYGTPGLRQ